MNYKTFITCVQRFFKRWINKINSEINQGKIIIKYEYSFTNILRIAESPNHFICELYGSKKYPPGQKISIISPNKIEKFSNTTSFFIPGKNINNSMKPGIYISGNYSGLGILRLITKPDLEKIEKIINLSSLKTIINCHNAEIPFIIDSNANFTNLYT